ncbi:hypothetical protein JCM14036_33840 [Desulfotomaculum defluvii]
MVIYGAMVKDARGQALIFVCMLLMLLSIVCSAALKLIHTEKLTMAGSQEELQAYYLAEAAVEKVFSILKNNVLVLESMAMNKTYGKFELEGLQKVLSGQNAASVQSLRNLFGLSYKTLEVTKQNGTSYTPVQNTKAGSIQTINITKTSATSNGYQLRIEASAKYGTAQKSLVTNIKVGLPLNRYQGVFVQASPNITNNSRLQSPLYILSEVQFQPVGSFDNNIYIKGNCLLQSGTNITTATLKVLGNVTLASGAQINGQLLASGDVLLNGDIVGGLVRSGGNVTVGDGHVGHPILLENGELAWDGDIYATRTITPESSLQFGTAFANQFQYISHTFLDYPNLDLTWYANNCDYFYVGDQVFRAEDLTEGIHYVQGNVTLSGFYQGNITLISSGFITIPAAASLQANKLGRDSFFILAKDKVQVESQAQVEALVYTAGTMQLANQALLAGTVICKDFSCHGAAICNQPLLNSVHPTWTTTEIEILAWQEKYPVFPMN